MAWTYTVVSTRVDPANFNVVADVEFDDGAGTVFTRQIFANDLDDARIARWAFGVTQMADAAQVNAAAITTGKPREPAGPSKEDAALDAKRALYSAALRDAQVNALNDPALDTALDELKAAETAKG